MYGMVQWDGDGFKAFNYKRVNQAAETDGPHSRRPEQYQISEYYPNRGVKADH